VTDNPIELRLKELGALKDAHPAFSTGATIVRRAQSGVLVVSRIDWAAKREYIVALNSGGAAASVSVTTSTPSSTWTGLAGTAGPLSSGADGTLSLTVPAMGASVYEAGSQIPSGAPSTPTLKVGNDQFSSLRRAVATVSGPAPVSVAFAIKRKPSLNWQLLAADDSPPFRAFLDKRKFAKRQKVYLVAIARSLDGQTAVSKVGGYVPRPR
jgi:hypothetical protein